jgi:hypothetical protein
VAHKKRDHWEEGYNSISTFISLRSFPHVTTDVHCVRYLDEHKEVMLRDNPRCNESWLANEHMRKFIGWFQDRISQSSDTQISEYLKKLACGPIFTVVTYQGYNINGYMFYTEQEDKKIKY